LFNHFFVFRNILSGNGTGLTLAWFNLLNKGKFIPQTLQRYYETNKQRNPYMKFFFTFLLIALCASSSYAQISALEKYSHGLAVKSNVLTQQKQAVYTQILSLLRSKVSSDVSEKAIHQTIQKDTDLQRLLLNIMNISPKAGNQGDGMFDGYGGGELG